MPRFVAQTLFQDGNMIASNFDIAINISQRGGLEYWQGNFTLPPSCKFNPNAVSRNTLFKIQLADGRSAEITIIDFTVSHATGGWNMQFASRDSFA
jgi:hypothetical protein